MSKIPVMSERDVLKILTKRNFEIVGRKGSHIRLKKITENKVYIVIVPDTKEIKIGTFKSIIRQSGLSREDFSK